MSKNTTTKIRFGGFHIEECNYKVTNPNAFNQDFSNYNESDNDFNLSDASAKDNQNPCVFYTKLKIEINNPKVGFELSSIIIGKFEYSEEIEDSFLESDWVNVNAPAILFPYLRAFITTLTAQSNLFTIVLPTMNFADRQKQTTPNVGITNNKNSGSPKKKSTSKKKSENN